MRRNRSKKQSSGLGLSSKGTESVTIGSGALNRPLRVLMPFAGSGVGGSVVSSAEMIRLLLEHGGVKPVVVTPESGPSSPLFEATGVELIHSEPSGIRSDTGRLGGKIKALPRYTRAYLNARRLLTELQPDVLHLNEDRLVLPWGAAAHSAKVPVVWHIRQERPNRMLDGIRLRLSRHLIFVADANRSRFASTRGLPPSTRLYNVVDTARYRPTSDLSLDKVRTGLNPNQLTLTFLGNLVERKRAEWVLQAAGYIQKHLPIQVVLIGAPLGPVSYVDSLHALAKQASEPESILFLGLRDDVADLLRASDVVTLPSVLKGEAFPRAIIEAMASGVPVVATDVAGVSEAVENNVTGFLVDPQDYQAYESALYELLGDTERRKHMGLRARDVATSRFSGTAMARSLLEIYDSVVNQNRHRH